MRETQRDGPPTPPTRLTPDPEGEGARLDGLVEQVYDELRSIARRCLAAERPDHTLQPTALVHEAWARLARHRGDASEGNFKALVATAMRHVLVDHARAKRGPKRGGGVEHVPLTVVGDVGGPLTSTIDVLDLDAALKRLACTFPVHVRIVEARFFAGMTHEEIAAALGIGLSTVEGHWRFARAWLKGELGESIPSPDS